MFAFADFGDDPRFLALLFKAADRALQAFAILNNDCCHELKNHPAFGFLKALGRYGNGPEKSRFVATFGNSSKNGKKRLSAREKLQKERRRLFFAPR